MMPRETATIHEKPDDGIVQKLMRQGISPKDFADAIGVSESSVKRWVDQGTLVATRTAGGHRRIPREEAMRWLRENRVQLVRPDRLGLPENTTTIARGSPIHVAAERFHQDLVEGRSAEARGVIAGLFIAGHTAAVIADEVIRPAMSRIGTLWEHGEEGIYVEHRATDICVHVVKELRGLLPDYDAAQEAMLPELPPVAVGGASSGDPYLVAPMLAAVTLVEVGYRTINLGPETPLRVLELASEQLGAGLVFLSVGVGPSDKFAKELSVFVDRLEARGVFLAIGGRLVEQLGLPPRKNLFIGRSFGELSAFARGVAGQVPRPVARVNAD
jgi:excisionase family DNA binding protein